MAQLTKLFSLKYFKIQISLVDACYGIFINWTETEECLQIKWYVKTQ